MTTTQIEWTEDRYNGNQGAHVGEFHLLVVTPPFGTLAEYPHQWQVCRFGSDKNIAGIVAHGDADSLEAAKLAALAAI